MEQFSVENFKSCVMMSRSPFAAPQNDPKIQDMMTSTTVWSLGISKWLNVILKNTVELLIYVSRDLPFHWAFKKYHASLIPYVTISN